jgi:hypothetical protein
LQFAIRNVEVIADVEYIYRQMFIVKVIGETGVPETQAQIQLEFGF